MLDDRRTAVTIGRAEDNDIIVKGNLISRLHARIELNKARFMLVDQRTNGTFVHGTAGDEQFVRRDSLAGWMREHGLDFAGFVVRRA